MSGLSDFEAQTLQVVARYVYGLPYSLEFREPVYISYPDLMETYLDSISYPMDLGTIMLKLRRREYSTKEDCARDLAIVFDNAIDFNSDLINLVSNARALRDFAAALWVEIVNCPFEGSCTGDEFAAHRIAMRKARLEFVRNIPLPQDEKTLLIDRLRSYTKRGALLEQHLDDILEACQEGSSAVTLTELAAPLYQHSNGNGSNLEDENACRANHIPCFLHILAPSSSFCNDFASGLSHLGSADLSFLSYVDDLFGEITVHLAEKGCRGYFISSIWARPHSIVWAQPNKSPWWPAAVLAGAEVPQAVTEANIGRLPGPIKQALNKLRPKSKDKERDGNFIPPGLYLAEYFGTHDFGWIKMDKTIPYPTDGALIVPAELKSSGGDRCTHDATALEEAQEAYPIVMSKYAVLELAPPEQLSFEQIMQELEEKIEAAQPALTSYLTAKRVPTGSGRTGSKKDKDGSSKDSSKSQSKKESKKKGKESVAVITSSADTAVHTGVVGEPKAYNLSFVDQLQSVDVTELSKKERAARRARILSVKLRLLDRAEVDSVSAQREACLDADIRPIFGGNDDNVGDEDYDGSRRVNESFEADDNAPEDTGGGSTRKRRRRAASVLSNPHSITAAQASSSVYHGVATLALHKRNRKNVCCPILHPRIVNFDSPLFSLENRSCEARKELLREELRLLNADLADINALLQKHGKREVQHSDKSSAGESAKGSGRQRVVQTVMAAPGRRNDDREVGSVGKGRRGGSRGGKGSRKRKGQEGRSEEAEALQEPSAIKMPEVSSYTSAFNMMPF